MIKNVLIPERIASFYLFSKRVIGIDLGRSHIRATQVIFKHRTCTVEKYSEMSVPTGPASTYDERVSETIRALLQTLDPYDALYTAIPSSLVVFKELRLPFIAYDKIKLVVDFEVEPLLPFPIGDAIIDFIITRQVPEQNSSDLLVAAVPKQHIAHHLQLFAAAGVDPELVSVDLFALYGLYKESPAYAPLPDGVALIDLGAHTTRIAYIQDSQLRLIRSLPKGMFTLAKSVSVSLKTDPNIIMEMLVRFGVRKTDDEGYTNAVTAAMNDFWDEILFTLNSFLTQSELNQAIKHIFLLGSGSQIDGVTSFVKNKTGATCSPLQLSTMLENNLQVVMHKNGISNAYVMSTSTAIPTPTTALFNLRQKEFSIKTDAFLFFKQLVMAASLSLLLLGTLGIHYFIQTKRLESVAQAAEQEAKEMLQDNFKTIPDDDLSEMVEQAEQEIKKEEKLWSVFNPARVSFLQYILELTSRIDQEALQFTIDKLYIADHTMRITAHVKNYEALMLLERELKQSKLFRYVEKQNDPDFTMTIKLAPTI